MDDRTRTWEAFEKAHPIRVEAKLTDPHPIIWQTAKRIGFALDPALAVPPTDHRWFDIRVSPERAERALCIADALIKACEPRGFELRPDQSAPPDKPVSCVIDGDTVGLLLSEQGGSYQRLSLRAAGDNWNDCLSRPLHKRLNSIILSLRKRISKAQARRREWERHERCIAELQRTRDELRAEVEAEREALDQLLSETNAWEKAQSIRAYVKAVEALPLRRGERRERKAWIKWAQAQTDRFDPLCKSPPSILDIPRQRYRELEYWECLNEDGSIDLL